MLVSRALLNSKSTRFDLKTEKAEISNIVTAMFEEVNKTTIAVGLAAPQIGEFRCVVLCKFNNAWNVLINPVVMKTSGSFKKEESCLSVKGKYAVTRPVVGTICYYDKSYKSRTVTLKGQELRRVLHEIDHLKGVCIDDIGEKVS